MAHCARRLPSQFLPGFPLRPLDLFQSALDLLSRRPHLFLRCANVCLCRANSITVNWHLFLRCADSVFSRVNVAFRGLNLFLGFMNHFFRVADFVRGAGWRLGG